MNKLCGETEEIFDEGILIVTILVLVVLLGRDPSLCKKGIVNGEGYMSIFRVVLRV